MSVVGMDNRGKARELTLDGIARGDLISVNSVGTSNQSIAILEAQILNFNLVHASWRGGFVIDSSIRGSYFQTVTFSHMVFRGVRFENLQLSRVRFESCFFSGCTFEHIQWVYGPEDLHFAGCAFEGTEVPVGCGVERSETYVASVVQGTEDAGRESGADRGKEAGSKVAPEKKEGEPLPSGVPGLSRFGELEL